LIEAFLPIGGIYYDVAYLTCRMLHRDHFFQTKISKLTDNPLYHIVLSGPHHPSNCLVYSPTRVLLLRVCMSGDLSTVEKYVEEILIDLMTEKVMSAGVHASSMGGLQ
jgi:hypothetical protein